MGKKRDQYLAKIEEVTQMLAGELTEDEKAIGEALRKMA